MAKILMVDDQPNNLLALQDVLEDVDAELLTALSGNEALSLVVQHDVAIVLLDVQMPGMDGFEVATLMRKVDHSKHIPIIFLTAYDNSREATFKGYDAGAVDYIHKPIAPKVLQSKVNVFLELYQQRRQIEQHAEELEERVAQRTSELEVALSASEAASRAKSEFVANTSHELRSPLNSLLILAQSLAANNEGNLTSKQVEAADVIYDSGQNLLTLINDILDLAKAEAGHMKVYADPVNLHDLAEKLRRQFVPLAEQKGIAINSEVADDVPMTVYTDGQRVEQVLRNLLSNAVKFTATGSVTLRLTRVKEDATPCEAIRFSVIDTGIGIPENKQQLIFDSFQQADGSTTRDYGGTGLGLTISRQFAALLGGELQVESQEGQGSQFTFLLPLKADSETDTKPVAYDEPNFQTDIPLSESEQPNIQLKPELLERIQGAKILLVDDDMRNTFALSRILSVAGMDVELAENGEVALEMLEQEDDFRLVLMDIMMPVMDGYEATSRIRKNERTADLPIIALTAYAEDEDQDKCLDAGANDYLAKPVDRELLLAKVCQHVLVPESQEICT